MAENPKEWPRVHTCLYDWCPRQSEECRRCDAVVKIIRDANSKREAAQSAE